MKFSWRILFRIVFFISWPHILWDIIWWIVDVFRSFLWFLFVFLNNRWSKVFDFIFEQVLRDGLTDLLLELLKIKLPADLVVLWIDYFLTIWVFRSLSPRRLCFLSHYWLYGIYIILMRAMKIFMMLMIFFKNLRRLYWSNFHGIVVPFFDLLLLEMGKGKLRVWLFLL